MGVRVCVCVCARARGGDLVGEDHAEGGELVQHGAEADDALRHVGPANAKRACTQTRARAHTHTHTHTHRAVTLCATLVLHNEGTGGRPDRI